MKLYVIIMLIGLMLELVKFSENYKIKAYKYHNPHSWRRPRWHPFPKHRKHYHSKRGPSQKYHYYEPEQDYHRYAPHHDSVDTSEHDKPYVIVIQLPQRKEFPKKEKEKYPYERLHTIDPPRDADYIDDNDDELKVYQLNNN
ncbi:hypothetical protein P5V15_003093 [Pogonomyrmex californicus]